MFLTYETRKGRILERIIWLAWTAWWGEMIVRSSDQNFVRAVQCKWCLQVKHRSQKVEVSNTTVSYTNASLQKASHRRRRHDSTNGRRRRVRADQTRATDSDGACTDRSRQIARSRSLKKKLAGESALVGGARVWERGVDWNGCGGRHGHSRRACPADTKTIPACRPDRHGRRPRLHL